MISNLDGINVRQEVEDAFLQKRDILIKLQRVQMLMGERSDGQKIGKYNNIPYAIKKQSINPLAGFRAVDLRLTGAFHAGIFADVRSNSVVLDSADEKAGDLINKYGEEIFGLNDKNAAEFSKKHLQPTTVKNIKNKLLK